MMSYLRRYLRPYLPVIEVGPGRGAITRLLLKWVDRSRFLGIEKDPKLCKLLWRKRLRVLCEDVLNLNLRLFKHKQVVGSLPYRGAKRIVSNLTRSGFYSALLVVQKEVFDSFKEGKTPLSKVLGERVRMFKIRKLPPSV